jgi:hypothetical protein
MTARPFLAILLATSLLSACSGGEDAPCTGKCDDLGETEALINGMPAEDYYAQLIYRVETRFGPSFLYPTHRSRTEVDGALNAHAEAYMLEDGSYFFVYDEWEQVNASTEAQIGESVILEGLWHVDGANLVLEGVGTARGSDFNAMPGFVLTYDDDIISSGLRGQAMPMALTSSSSGLFHVLGLHDNGTCDEEFGEYCIYDDCEPCVCGDGQCQQGFLGDPSEDETTCPADCAE